jgi:hypothetical protein
MAKIAYCIAAVMTMFFVAPLNAQVDDEEEAYQTQVPTGMELQQVGKKPAYKIVLPKGTAIRREGDLRIVEGTGEYASRKFVEYDDLLDKMNTEIASLREDVEEIKKALSEMRKNKLASK